MSFLYPLGLLGLIGVPILILIYILKNKYKEEMFSSTYIWELSNRFLKKKKPFSRFQNIISLILQLLVIIILSFSVAHPVFTINDSAENICFIVDASGSMNITHEKNDTRFDVAKKEINKIIDKSYLGSSYTIILADDEVRTLAKLYEDKDEIKEVVNNMQVGQSASDVLEAISIAQNYYSEGEVSKVYLLTDRNYEEIENIELINISNHCENYALGSVEYEIDNELIICHGNITSYENDAEININVYLDDKLVVTETYEVIHNVENSLGFTIEFDYEEFSSLKVEIANKDALDLDNSVIVYNIAEENESDVLLVSSQPFYLESIIKAIGHNTLEVISPSNYVPSTKYDIYIFDGYTPSELPSAGTVWLINTSTNIDNSGFIVQGEQNAMPNITMSYTNENSVLYRQLTQDIKYSRIKINNFKKYSLYRKFTTILAYNNIPMIFVGTTDTGLREIVFAFDLHDSDFPLLYDYIPIMRNLFNYSSPIPLDEANYTVGEEVFINLSTGISSIRVESPSGKVDFLDLNDVTTSYTLKEVGTYKITINSEDGNKEYNIYSSFNNKESEPYVIDAKVSLIKTDVENKNNAILDNLFIIIIGAVIFLLIDWVVYAREQY